MNSTPPAAAPEAAVVKLPALVAVCPDIQPKPLPIARFTAPLLLIVPTVVEPKVAWMTLVTAPVELMMPVALLVNTPVSLTLIASKFVPLPRLNVPLLVKLLPAPTPTLIFTAP